MRLAAGAPRLVQVVLHPLRRRGRDLLLLKRPGNPQVSRVRQVTAAGAAPSGIVVLGPVRDLPRHRRARAARLLPPLLLLRPLRGPPLLPGRLPPRQVIRRRRHRGVPAVPRPRPLRRRQLLPQVSDHRLQRRDLLRLRREPPPCSPSRSACSRISASRGSSAAANRSQPAIIPETTHSHHGNTTPPLKRNRRSPTATAGPRDLNVYNKICPNTSGGRKTGSPRSSSPT